MLTPGQRNERRFGAARLGLFLVQGTLPVLAALWRESGLVWFLCGVWVAPACRCVPCPVWAWHAPRSRRLRSIGVERVTCRLANATPVGRRAPRRGSSMRLSDITRHPARVRTARPRNTVIEDLLPGRGKREEVFPQRKGTCQGEAGSLAWTGQAARSRRTREGFERLPGLTPTRRQNRPAPLARVRRARSSRPQVKRGVAKTRRLAEKGKSFPWASQRAPAAQTPVFLHPPAPGGPPRARQSAVACTLTGARTPPASLRRRLLRPAGRLAVGSHRAPRAFRCPLRGSHTIPTVRKTS